jgi:hypothetical protein
VKLTTHLYLVPRLRMHGAIHLLPQYAFVAWWSVKAQGQLYLYLLPYKYVSSSHFIKILITHLTSVLHVGSLASCHKFISTRLCNISRYKPDRSLFRSERMSLLVDSLYAEAVDYKFNCFVRLLTRVNLNSWRN